MPTTYPASLLCDFYKVSHKKLYPENTEYIYSTFTPRSNKYFPETDGVVVFGIQGFIQEWLINYFDKHFFTRGTETVVAEYERYIKYALGENNPETEHIRDLHELGYLPVKICALPEGTFAPIKCPVLTIENTNPEFFWVTNYLETLLSAELWQPMTSATMSYQYRKLLNKYAMQTVGNTDAVQFQGHDFSLRGMAGLYAGAKSGAGHLLSFVGTDTIPAISYLEEYYGTNIERELVGCSVNATEHSVQSANMPDNGDEYETFKRIITEVYSTGIVSIVSDTLDFWDNVTRVLPKLKDEIMARGDKTVIRPDSGCPVLILCGNPDAKTAHEKAGLIECLYNIFGGTVNEKGYIELNPVIGAIYGDSITLERAEEICRRLEKKGFASTNVVFGIGSFTFQYTTRDSLGFAMKATYAVINGEDKMLFKNPKTDDGTKKSQRGCVFVGKEDDGTIFYRDGLRMFDGELYQESNLLQTVFKDGKSYNKTTLSEIRERLTN